jgi:hypothetical protein
VRLQGLGGKDQAEPRNSNTGKRTQRERIKESQKSKVERQKKLQISGSGSRIQDWL